MFICEQQGGSLGGVDQKSVLGPKIKKPCPTLVINPPFHGPMTQMILIECVSMWVRTPNVKSCGSQVGSINQEGMISWNCVFKPCLKVTQFIKARKRKRKTTPAQAFRTPAFISLERIQEFLFGKGPLTASHPALFRVLGTPSGEPDPCQRWSFYFRTVLTVPESFTCFLAPLSHKSEVFSSWQSYTCMKWLSCPM